MIDAASVLARLLSRKEGRAVPVRSSFELTPDPRSTFGIAPIKIVAEDVVQALAFGGVDEQALIVTRLHPLGRSSEDLEPFAASLIAWTDAVVAVEGVPRVWVPHEAALATLELLGHRYRSNKSASETLRRMGGICFALAREARLAGQQSVAVAGALLKSHVVTGQAPIKDGHLGALLAWIDPPAGTDPVSEADRRALIPASGVLIREEDDRLEALRKSAKRGGAQGAAAENAIHALLKVAAQREWTFLVGARRAFWNLKLDELPALAQLEEESAARMHFALSKMPQPASQPHALARELMIQEHAMQAREDVLARGDLLVRESQRRKGKIALGEVMEVTQPKANFKPCRVRLAIAQPILRVRVGTKLSTLDGRAEGRVIEVRDGGLDGGTQLVVELSKGVRRNSCPTLGSREDWTDSGVFGTFGADKVLQELKKAKPDVVYGAVASPATLATPVDDLLRLARSLRR